MTIRFEWDAAKARSNLAKHHVSFEVAVRVFTDPLQLSILDRFENDEHRWQTIGNVDGHVLLLVAHTVGEDKDGTEVIRLISARKADSKERKRYDQTR